MRKAIALRVFAAALAVAAFTATAAATGDALAQEQALNFDIREQTLSGALVEFSRRSGVVIVAPAHLVAGKRAPEVRGVFTADAALSRLLARTGLEPRRRPEGGLALVASAAAGSGANATAPAAEPEPTIVVTGQRLMTMTLGYATALAGDQPAAAEQIPRWNARLCPSIAGLSPVDAQALIDHIARRAGEVGLNAESSGCQPNLVVIFATDSDQVARRIVETRRDLLGYLFTQETVTAGRAALNRFATTPRPVRWWHVSRTTMADGEQLSSSRPLPPPTSALNSVERASGDNALSGFEGVDAVRSQGSRVRSDTRRDLNFVLIIVDSRRVAGASQQAVADYVAMASLAQIDPEADMTGFDSILNLFAEESEGRPATEMTIWDLSYLRGLYEARPDAASMRQHTTNIARRMADQLADDSNGEAP